MITKELEEKLNYYYFHDIEYYSEYLKMIKDKGYKVMRNSKGEHIVKGGELDFLNNIFGGVFG